MVRPVRTCPECEAPAPAQVAGCPRCGHIFQAVGDAAAGLAAAPGGSSGWKPVFAATCGCFVLVALVGAVVSWLVGRELEGIGEQFQRVQVQADLRTLRGALEAYADEHGDRYPERLEQLTERDGGGPWIERLPTDRWDRPFVFEPPPRGDRAGGPGRLFTLGADGVRGGEGDDADLDEQALGLRRGPR